MIDEFQNIDGLQHELMEALCGYYKNLFIVGDPDQALYTRRGVKVKYLLDFDKRFPQCQNHYDAAKLPLHPPSQILAVANSLIGKSQHRIKKGTFSHPAGRKAGVLSLCQECRRRDGMDHIPD